MPDWIAVRSTDELLKQLGVDAQNAESVGKAVYTNPEASIRSATLLAGYIPATPLRRLAGSFICGFILLLAIGTIDSTNTSSAMLMLLIPLLSLATYYFQSGNVGHLLLNMKVVNATTGEDVKSPLTGFFREFVKGWCYFIIIPLVTLLFDKRKQNLYDKLFNTLVVMNTPKQ